jgi:hypothetical protein
VRSWPSLAHTPPLTPLTTRAVGLFKPVKMTQCSKGRRSSLNRVRAEEFFRLRNFQILSRCADEKTPRLMARRPYRRCNRFGALCRSVAGVRGAGGCLQGGVASHQNRLKKSLCPSMSSVRCALVVALLCASGWPAAALFADPSPIPQGAAAANEATLGGTTRVASSARTHVSALVHKAPATPTRTSIRTPSSAAGSPQT